MRPQHIPNSSQRYRPDIDGLRALAVTLVVLSHLRTRLTGGFVGADVFFVLSGYLISGHILAAIGDGGFSLVEFERSHKRLSAGEVHRSLGMRNACERQRNEGGRHHAECVGKGLL